MNASEIHSAQPFLHRFEIRWQDLDPNRHVANATFAAYMTHTRMQYLISKGIDQKFFARHKMGPVIFWEEFHYLREVMPDEGEVFVDVQLLGLSQDERFAKFSHSLFNPQGKLCVFSRLAFGWFDLENRKLRIPPPELAKALHEVERSPDFRLMDKSDTRRMEVLPERRKLDLDRFFAEKKP